MVQRSYKNFVFRFCFVIVSSPPFNIIILVLILANTYILADYRFDESLKEAEVQMETKLGEANHEIQMLKAMIGM